MNKKEFSKWLEKVEKDISSKEIILDDLQLSANKSQVSSILSQVDKTSQGQAKSKKTFKPSLSASTFPNPEKSVKVMNSIKSSKPNKALVPCKSSRPIESDPVLFNFKPEISKNSQEIAKKLGPSSSRLLAPKIRSSLDSLTISENQLNFNSLTSVNPLSTFNSGQGLNSMTSFNVFNSCNSFNSFQSINSGQSLNQGLGSSRSQFPHSPSDLKGKSVKPEEFEVTAKRMFDWNKARLEKLRQNQEARMRLDLETCTFRPDIGEGKEEKKGKIFEVKKNKKKNTENLGKKGSKGKIGYSGKVIETCSRADTENLQGYEDLDDFEYEHALKRLHWELESIVLKD